MKTNKRTVWFLTLLSLVAVISIYYLKEKPMPFEGLSVFWNDAKESGKLTEKTDELGKEMPVFAEAIIFDEMRMEVRNERSKLAEQLTTKVGSSETTAAEKSSALDEMAKLTKRTSAEALMELQIVALGYPEAFVHTEDGEVKVTVLSTEGQSLKMADEIARYVKMNWDDARNVKVSFAGDPE